jgi:hypothetical protein
MSEHPRWSADPLIHRREHFDGGFRQPSSTKEYKAGDARGTIDDP